MVNYAWIVARKWWAIGWAASLTITAASFWREGNRVGYHSGFAAGVSSVPKVEAKCETKIEPTTCEAKEPTVQIRYVKTVGKCPQPEVTISGGGATATTGGATASSSVIESPPIPPSPNGSPGGSGGTPARWTIAALAGVGGAGPEVGGAAMYRLLGPVTVGAYGRVPLNEPGRASVGGLIGVQF